MSKVVILGCGFAGGVMALRAIQLGFRAVLLEAPRPDVGGIEILPSRARHLLNELHLGPVLEGLRPGFGSGMLRRGEEGLPLSRAGRALHLDRLALRQAVIAQAVSRGAEIRNRKRLSAAPDDVFATIDATGRFAAWSHPVLRHDRARADILRGPASLGSEIAEVVQIGSFWAYAAADECRCTIGVVHHGEYLPGAHDERVTAAFGLKTGTVLEHLGRRPAFVQEAREPVSGRRIAIGDAAFCHNPIAGRGLSFALGSAFAAGAVLKTWRDHPDREELARGYYRAYVAAERDRHLAFIAHGDAPEPAPPLPSHLVWSASDVQVALAVEDGIGEATAVETATGTPVRWLGRFDLLDVKALCGSAQPAESVLAGLGRLGLTLPEAAALLRWALQNGIVRAGKA